MKVKFNKHKNFSIAGFCLTAALILMLSVPTLVSSRTVTKSESSYLISDYV